MNLIEWWVNWFEDWFLSPSKADFWAGVFVGFLFFCGVLFVDEWLTTRRYNRKRKDEE